MKLDQGNPPGGLEPPGGLDELDAEISRLEGELAVAEVRYGAEKQKQEQLGSAIQEHRPHTTQVFVRAGDHAIWIPKAELSKESRKKITPELLARVDAEVAARNEDDLGHRVRDVEAIRRDLLDTKDMRRKRAEKKADAVH